jgi:hypothetical protein
MQRGAPQEIARYGIVVVLAALAVASRCWSPSISKDSASRSGSQW